MTASINCPYCGEEVPVRIRISGELTGTYPPFKHEYIDIGGLSSELDKPIPEIIISLDVDLEAIAKDIDKIIAEKRERQKKIEAFDTKRFGRRKHKY